MKLHEEFWSKPERWPNDTLDFVFLARAVDVLGRILFQDNWSGSEPTREPLPALPQLFLLANRSQRETAHDLLLTYRPDLNRTPWVLLRVSREKLSFTDEEWTAAREIGERENSERIPGWDRFQKVRAHIARLAQADVLKTSWRRLEGGDFTAIPPNAWNTERIGSRFVSCQFNPNRPFEEQFLGGHWIFVARESLEGCLQHASGHQSAVGFSLPTKPTPPDKPADAAPASAGAPTKGALITSEKRRLFKEWRESLGGRIPKLPEDIAAMKAQGINRDDARHLSKEYPKLPRGKPKQEV